MLCGAGGGSGGGGGGGAAHRGRYYVAVRRGGEETKRDLELAVERLHHRDALRIVISDDEDPTFLCVLHVSRSDYEELKKQQGLLIDFDNFPGQLVRLLQQCAANNMFLILQQSNPLQYYFEVVEHNEFKRLVHLSLKTGPASDDDIKAHMAESINNLKKSLNTLKATSLSNETTLTDKCMCMERKIHDLALSLTRMEEDKLKRETELHDVLKKERDRLAQERLEWQKNADIVTKNHSASLQEAIARKDKLYDELNTRCRQMKDNMSSLEAQLSDKTNRLALIEKEVQKSHIEVATLKAKNTTLERDGMEKERQTYQLQNNISDMEKEASGEKIEKEVQKSHIEVATLKAKNTTLERDGMEKERQTYQLQNNISDMEKNMKEMSEKTKELSNCVDFLQREKRSLEQKLSLAESLVDKKNQAVQTTSEQLLKANQIISKQNADLIELKEKLLCRTQIALEQEKVIERHGKEMELLKSKEGEAIAACDKLRGEVASLTDKLTSQEKIGKEKDETIKNNNLVIQWLHKKLEENSIPATSYNRDRSPRRPESSTPRYRPDASHSAHDVSEDMPNFYATSSGPKENSPRTEVFSRSGKPGLDPRYLQPSSDDRPAGSEKSKTTLSSTTTKGKENKSANLPKVDYRENKSGRTVSYRATPVSAYFPYK